MASSPAPFTRQFPLELLHDILEYTLPPLRRRTFRQRADILAKLSLVNRTIGVWAQRELFRSPNIYDAEQLTNLTNTLRVKSSLRAAVTAVEILDCDLDITELLQLLPELKELYLSGSGYSETVYLHYLTRLRKLRKVVLWGVTLDVGGCGSLTLPALRELSLCGVTTIAGGFEDFIRPPTLPGLRALACAFLNYQPATSVGRSAPALNRIVASLSPQLELLVRDCETFKPEVEQVAVPTCWRSDWDCDSDEDEKEMWTNTEAWTSSAAPAQQHHAFRPTLPIRLRHLQAFASAFTTPIPCLAAQKTLYAPVEMLDLDASADAQVHKLWQDVVAIAEQRGVAIIYEEHDFMEDSQVPRGFLELCRT